MLPVNPPRILRGSAVAFGAALVALAALSLAVAQISSRPAGAAIVLPQKLLAGERATLAVLDDQGRLLAGAKVEFTGGEIVTTDSTGRAGFDAPAMPGVLLARLPGENVRASTTIVAPAPVPADGVAILEYPNVVPLHDRFSISGAGFRGEAEANHVALGDRPALVLAASPGYLVAMADPHTPVGPAQLSVEVGGRSPGPVSVRVVSLSVTAPEKQLAAGEKGKLEIRVHGTEQRLAIEVRNLSPGTVELSGGNVQRVTSAGGVRNHAEIELAGIQPGDFSISARIVPGIAGAPDMETVRQLLLQARSLARGDWRKRVDRVIRRVERTPQEIPRIRREIEKLLADRPEGEFGRLLEAAWRELLAH